MWKNVLGVSALTLAVLSLAACGNSKSSDSKDKAGDSKKSEESTTLLMYQVGDKPKNFDELMKIANKRIKEKIGVTVDLQYIGWGDWGQKMPAIINSGEEYDVAFASGYVANAQKGAFADLTELADKYAKDYLKQLPEMYIKGNKINGKLYAIPVYGNAWAQQRLTFNDDFVKKYKLDISKVDGSYESATEVLKQFHEKEPSIAAFAVGQGFKVSGEFDHPLGNSFPLAVKLDGNKDNPKLINQYEDPELQKSLMTMHEWYKAGLIPADAPTNQTGYPLGSNTWFMREETQGPMDYGDTILRNAAQKDLTSRPLTKQNKTTAQAQMANFVVSNTSKNKEKAVQFLNLLNTDPELLNGLVYGVEGKAWEKVGENRMKWKDMTQGRMSAWNTGNNMILYVQDSITDEQVKERDESIKNASESPILGFNPITDKVKTEVSNISNVMARYSANLNTGAVNPTETLPNLIKDLKAAGLDKVQAELQSQLDEFVKANK